MQPCGSAKGKGKGKGKGKESPAQLAEQVKNAEKAAEAARLNKERVNAQAAAREEARKTAARATTGLIATAAEEFGFVAEAGYMQGRAEAQNDRHVVVKDLAKAAKSLKIPVDSLDKPLALFAIYDGHSGTRCSEYCAQHFHKKLLPRLAKVSIRREQSVEEQIPLALMAALQELDEDFMAKYRTDRSGCCVQIALLVGRRLYAAGLGAARAVLFEEKTEQGQAWEATALHKVHDLANAEELARVKAAGGSVVDVAPGVKFVGMPDFEKRLRDIRIQQASGMGVGQTPPVASPFSRSLGDRDLKVPTKVSLALPEVRTVLLSREHRALALVSNGISDAMSLADISSVLHYNSADEKKGVSELVQEAYNRGSAENVSAVVVHFRWPKKRTHDTSSAVPRAALAPRTTTAGTSPAAEAAAQPAADETEEERAKKMHKHADAEAVDPRDVQEAVREAFGIVRVEADDQRPTAEELAARWLEWTAMPLCCDLDGDVAHEFFEEHSNGDGAALRRVPAAQLSR